MARHKHQQRRRIHSTAQATQTRQPPRPAFEPPLLAATDARFGHNFSQVGVSATAVPPVQANPDIGPAGDQYEQEADRVAEQIVRMPEPRAREGGRTPSASSTTGGASDDPPASPSTIPVTSLVQRKPAAGPGAPRSIRSLPGEGQPLPKATRAFFEPRFGHDFSQVRVHTGPPAAEAARSINARAFTAGQDIVFGAGEYAPDSGQGQRLLAHELTHVVQQTGRIQRAIARDVEEEHDVQVVTDGEALIRSDPPELKPIGGVIPTGTRVRILDSAIKGTRSYVLVQEVLPEGSLGPGNLWGWTLRSNLGGFGAQEQSAIAEPDAALLEEENVSYAEEPVSYPEDAVSAAEEDAVSYPEDEQAQSREVRTSHHARQRAPRPPRALAEDLTEAMHDFASFQLYSPVSGMEPVYNGIIQGRQVMITEAEYRELEQQIKAIVQTAFENITAIADDAEGFYQAHKQNYEDSFVGPAMHLYSGGEKVLRRYYAERDRYFDHLGDFSTAFQKGDYVGMAWALTGAEAAARRARTIMQVEYTDAITQTGENIVTGLEITSTAAFAIVGLLAIVASGGAAVGATSALGMKIGGTAAAANAIALGAPTVAILGRAGVEEALGMSVDWGNVAIDVALNLVLAKFGGVLSQRLQRFLAGSGSQAVRVAVSHLLTSLADHQVSTALTVSVKAVYRKLQGKKVTWDDFVNELVAYATDPVGLAMATTMGATSGRVDVKHGLTRRTRAAAQASVESGADAETSGTVAGAPEAALPARGVDTESPADASQAAPPGDRGAFADEPTQEIDLNEALRPRRRRRDTLVAYPPPMPDNGSVAGVVRGQTQERSVPPEQFEPVGQVRPERSVEVDDPGITVERRSTRQTGGNPDREVRGELTARQPDAAQPRVEEPGVEVDPTLLAEARQLSRAPQPPLLKLQLGRQLKSGGDPGSLGYNTNEFGVFESVLPDGTPVAVKVYPDTPDHRAMFEREIVGVQGMGRTGMGPRLHGRVDVGEGKLAFAMDRVAGGFGEAHPDATPVERAEALYYQSRITRHTSADVEEYGRRLWRAGFYASGEVQGFIQADGSWRAIDGQGVSRRSGKPEEYEEHVRNINAQIEDLQILYDDAHPGPVAGEMAVSPARTPPDAAPLESVIVDDALPVERVGPSGRGNPDRAVRGELLARAPRAGDNPGARANEPEAGVLVDLHALYAGRRDFASIRQSVDIVVGRHLASAGEGHAIMRRLADGDVGALRDLGIADVAPDFDSRSTEWGLGQLPDGTVVIVKGSFGGVNWEALPDLVPLAHSHPLAHNRLLRGDDGSGLSLSELIGKSNNTDKVHAFPSAADVQYVAERAVAVHTVHTPYVHRGGDRIGNPQPNARGSGISFDIVSPQLLGYSLDAPVYKSTWRARSGDDGTPIWEGEVYSCHHRYIGSIIQSQPIEVDVPAGRGGSSSGTGAPPAAEPAIGPATQPGSGAVPQPTRRSDQPDTPASDAPSGVPERPPRADTTPAAAAAAPVEYVAHPDYPHVRFDARMQPSHIQLLMRRLAQTADGARIVDWIRAGDIELTITRDLVDGRYAGKAEGRRIYVSWSREGLLETVDTALHEGAHALDPTLNPDMFGTGSAEHIPGSRLSSEAIARAYEYDFRREAGLRPYDDTEHAYRNAYDTILAATGDERRARIAAERAMIEAMRDDPERYHVESRAQERAMRARPLEVPEPPEPRLAPPESPLERELFGDIDLATVEAELAYRDAYDTILAATGDEQRARAAAERAYQDALEEPGTTPLDPDDFAGRPSPPMRGDAPQPQSAPGRRPLLSQDSGAGDTRARGTLAVHDEFPNVLFDAGIRDFDMHALLGELEKTPQGAHIAELIRNNQLEVLITSEQVVPGAAGVQSGREVQVRWRDSLQDAAATLIHEGTHRLDSIHDAARGLQSPAVRLQREVNARIHEFAYRMQENLEPRSFPEQLYRGVYQDVLARTGDVDRARSEAERALEDALLTDAERYLLVTPQEARQLQRRAGQRNQSPAARSDEALEERQRRTFGEHFDDEPTLDGPPLRSEDTHPQPRRGRQLSAGGPLPQRVIAPEDVQVGTRDVVLNGRQVSVMLDFTATIDGQNVRWGHGVIRIDNAGNLAPPLLDLDTRVEVGGQKVMLKLSDRQSFTRLALEAAIKVYEGRVGRRPDRLGGELRHKNLLNFQREYALLQAMNPQQSREELARAAVARTSFGTHRRALGYERIEINELGDDMLVDLGPDLGERSVPGAIDVDALPPIPAAAGEQQMPPALPFAIFPPHSAPEQPATRGGTIPGLPAQPASPEPIPWSLAETQTPAHSPEPGFIAKQESVLNEAGTPGSTPEQTAPPPAQEVDLDDLFRLLDEDIATQHAQAGEATGTPVPPSAQHIDDALSALVDNQSEPASWATGQTPAPAAQRPSLYESLRWLFRRRSDLVGYLSSSRVRQKFRERFMQRPEYQQQFAHMDEDFGAHEQFIEQLKQRKPEYAHIATEDLVALHAYTGSANRDINSALGRTNRKKLKQLDSFIKAIASALTQLQPYRGTVYRGKNLSDAQASKYLDNVGGVVTEDMFFSASRDNAFEGNAQFTVISKNGKEVHELSQHPDENEVLFAPGTRFRVRKAERDYRGNYTIELEEL